MSDDQQSGRCARGEHEASVDSKKWSEGFAVCKHCRVVFAVKENDKDVE